MEKKECAEVLGEKTSHSLEILINKGLIKEFYLAGGTGVALFLKHRQSYDLDFFSAKPFNEDLLTQKISDAGKFELEKKEEGTITGFFEESLISLFYYPYKLLRKPREICGVLVADLIDISCMKIDAIAGRGSKKDFIDLYMIIKSGYTLGELLNYFEKKYKALNYNMIHIQKGLVYFDDADREEAPRMLQDLPWPEVKDFFENEVRKLN